MQQNFDLLESLSIISIRDTAYVCQDEFALDLPDTRQRAEVVYQLSVMLCSRGRISDSERVITEFFDGQDLDLN
jgi:hypothetical protein